MKVLPFKIPKPENATLVVQEDIGVKFYDKLHQHQETQISLIKKGEGTFIIGDHVGEFKQGDVFVIGENLPHVFNNDELEDDVHMISIFFMKSSYGEEFFNFPEFEKLDAFFSASHLGFITRSAPEGLLDLLIGIVRQKGLERFISFMEILKNMSNHPAHTLSSAIHRKTYGEEEGKRMRNIFEFTLQNFDKSISLEQVSDVANMTPNAFCRYFKQRTNKTYVNFLLDIRIGNACKLLAKKTDLSIAEVSYRSGFNNLTNFNRKFKALKGVTPSYYRKQA
ncbi:AraC family transcriptional regulator [Lutimonas sp.]|uniref:AraC family transcriptional regulator n=1 Tax=Lutimonas sp. TaxID=1872403 RepID=UPI003D9B1D83